MFILAVAAATLQKEFKIKYAVIPKVG